MKKLKGYVSDNLDKINVTDLPITSKQRTYLEKTKIFDRLFYKADVPKRYYMAKLALLDLADKVNAATNKKSNFKTIEVVRNKDYIDKVRLYRDKGEALRRVFLPKAQAAATKKVSKLLKEAKGPFELSVQILFVGELLENILYPFEEAINEIEDTKKRVSYKMLYEALREDLTVVIKNTSDIN